jgi:hypothetical protein
MPNQKLARTTRVVVRVDTHRDEHLAVAIDQLGSRLGDRLAGYLTVAVKMR